MYAPFFGLKREPFSIAPDPRYLFMSERHREALAHLLYGVGGGGGFVLLTGEIGAGKTTVCRCFLEQIPRRCNVAYVFNPKLTVEELLKSICDEFHIPYDAHPPSGGTATGTVKDYLDPLNEFLLKTHAVGQNNVLIIDEAQSLSAEVLEQLRLLTNLETSERKLLQIILIGQPELRNMLARPELEQLAQRVIARFHLEALSPEETGQYIRHRLAVAGLPNARIFPDALISRVHHWTRGVPRRINLLCDRAMLGAYAQGRDAVDRATLDQAAAEVFDQGAPLPPEPTQRSLTMPRWGWGVVGVSLAVGVSAVTLALVERTAKGPLAKAAVTGDKTTLTVGAAASRPGGLVPAASSLTLVPSGLLAKLALPPQGDVGSLLQEAVREEGSAWQALGELWGAGRLGSGDACKLLQQQGVRCFTSNGGLALIRQLGRPAILMLQNKQGERVHALLTGLTGRSAVLSVGGEARTVPLSFLASVWRGDFGTLWRVPPAYEGKLAMGQSGPAVQRLATQLAAWAGEPFPGEPARVDAELISRIKAFQVAQGLAPDGVAGAVTFMQLNRATGVDEPRLQTELAAR